MTPTWHVITCRTCDSPLVSMLLEAGYEHTGLLCESFQAAHRNTSGCPATDIVLCPCTEAEVVARLEEDRRREQATGGGR